MDSKDNMPKCILEKENIKLRKQLANAESSVQALQKELLEMKKGVASKQEDSLTVESDSSVSRATYRGIIDTSPIGHALFDKDYVVVKVNDALCQLTGYPREELIGRELMDFIPDDTKQYFDSELATLVENSQLTLETHITRKDGTSIHVSIHCNILYNSDKQVIGYSDFITDISERKKSLILAGEVQKNLLPQNNPPKRGLDIAGRTVPCDETGGDYFDYIWKRATFDHSCGIVVGDISGHGVDAALLMTSARAFLRMRAEQPGTIDDIIRDMNQHLCQDVFGTGRFMTLFYLDFDITNKSLSWVRAGHDPAILYTPEADTFDELRGDGIPLGVTTDMRHEAMNMDGLSTGQIIAIGTDGIWEAHNTEGKMFGKERLKGIIRENANQSAERILNAVYETLEEFTLGQKPSDDITLVIVKIE